MSKDMFMDEREYQMANMSHEESYTAKLKAEEWQEDYLLGLIETSSYRNSDDHDALEKEITRGIDKDRFEEIKAMLLDNQISKAELGMAGQKEISNHIKKISK